MTNILTTTEFLEDFTGSVFQTFNDKDSINHPEDAKVYLKYDEHLFKYLNSKNIGIYFTANFFKDKRQITHLTKLNAIFGDLDLGKQGDGQTLKQLDIKKRDLCEALSKLPIQPNFIIITRNGIQPLWLIDEDSFDLATQKQFTNVIQGLIKWSKDHGSLGDEVKDVTRVLRLPGYNHCKSDPFLVNGYKLHNKKSHLDDLEKMFPFFDEKVIADDNAKTYQDIKTLDDLTIKEIAIEALKDYGEAQAYFDNIGRLVISRGVTGAFLGKTGNRDFIGSTSHDIPCGNKITFVTRLLNLLDNKEAYQWIKKRFNLQTSNTNPNRKTTGTFNPNVIDIPELNAEALIKNILYPPKYLLFGYECLDTILDGIKLGFTYLIAAKSGNCKSALILNILYNQAENHVPCAFFDLENGQNLGDKRLLQIKTGWDKVILLGFTEKKCDIKILEKETEELKKIPLYIYYGHNKLFTEGIRKDAILAAIRKVVKEKGVKVVAVDNLRNIEIEGTDENRFLSGVLTDFDKLANELNIAIFLIHHITIKGQEKGIKSEDFDDLKPQPILIPPISKVLGTSDLVNKIKCALTIALDPHLQKLYIWIQKNRDGEADKRFTLNINLKNLCISDPPLWTPVVLRDLAGIDISSDEGWYKDLAQGRAKINSNGNYEEVLVDDGGKLV